MTLTLTGLDGMPELTAGADLAAVVVVALRENGIELLDGDVLVVSSKVVSKAAGLTAAAGSGDPGTRDRVVLEQSRRVVAERLTPRGTARIVESLAGPVMAAAGVDASNTGSPDVLLLLPHDPDGCARELRDGIRQEWGRVAGGEPPAIGVVLSDTAGRPWRTGQVDFALGAAGVRVREDLRGAVDADGRELAVTERCLVDEVAAAADLVKGKATAVPVAHLRGLAHLVVGTGPGAAGEDADEGARSVVRTGPADWFALGAAESVRAALGVAPGTTEAAECGIASVLPEDEESVLRRALTVGLHDQPGVSARLEPGGVRLTGEDPFALGQAVARVRVALTGEGRTSEVEREGGEVRLSVRPAARR
ncbi:MAG TPA: coenzyme F420-0:L-glutamate ligase [Segeticoccus sp.]|nr:coenzyme F420-0:L-glutamate ligase [Segeticoccus sp.]